jgi:hypothetical protein
MFRDYDDENLREQSGFDSKSLLIPLLGLLLLLAIIIGAAMYSILKKRQAKLDQNRKKIQKIGQNKDDNNDTTNYQSASAAINNHEVSAAINNQSASAAINNQSASAAYDVDSDQSDQTDQRREPPVVIIGGGLCGLITALKLTQAGIPFIILESQGHLGGRVATIRYPNGDTSEAPLEEIWARNPVVPILRDLGIEMTEENAHSSVIIDGKIMVGNGDPYLKDYLASIFPDRVDRESFIKWNDETWKLYQDIVKYCLKPHKSHTSTYIPPPPHLGRLMSNMSFKDYIEKDCSYLPRRVQEWIRLTVEPEMTGPGCAAISALDGIDEFRIFLKGKLEGEQDNRGDEKNGGKFGESCFRMKKGNSELIKQLVARLPAHSIRLNCVVGDIKYLDPNTYPDYIDYRAGFTPSKEDGEKFRKEQEKRNPRLPEVSYIQNHPVGSKDLIHLVASQVVLTVPLCNLQHIRFSPPLDSKKLLAIKTNKIGSYIKVHMRFDKQAEQLFLPKYGENLFTLITGDVIGAIYRGGGPDASSTCPKPPKVNSDSVDKDDYEFGNDFYRSSLPPNSFPSFYPQRGQGARETGQHPLMLTSLVYGRNAEKLVRMEDTEIGEIVVENIERLFPGIKKWLQEVEVFTFPKAVAHWSLKHGRSRFDELAHHLRKPFYGGRVFIGGDMTYGSHSEGAALSALGISDQIISDKLLEKA